MKYLLVDVCIHITCYYYASCINTIQLKLNEQFKHKVIVVSNAKSIIIHAHKIVSQHILCSCISNLTNLISSIYQISCRKCILNKLENYISINYTIMIRWFFLSVSSPFSLLFPLFSSSLQYAQGRLAPPKGVHLKLSTSMSSKPSQATGSYRWSF